MIAIGRGISRRVSACLLVLILLVPVALSGHSHARSERAASDTCAICAVTRHAPAATPVPVLQIVPGLASFEVAVTYVAAPRQVDRPFTPGRAPPVIPSPYIA